jgi:hypothetical protein
MKLLVVLLVVLFGVWLWRRGQRVDARGAAGPARRRCAAHGGLRPLRRARAAVQRGRRARRVYCGEAHRREAEGG